MLTGLISSAAPATAPTVPSDSLRAFFCSIGGYVLMDAGAAHTPSKVSSTWPVFVYVPSSQQPALSPVPPLAAVLGHRLLLHPAPVGCLLLAPRADHWALPLLHHLPPSYPLLGRWRPGGPLLSHLQLVEPCCWPGQALPSQLQQPRLAGPCHP